MAEAVGGLFVQLGANVAQFQEDMGKVSQLVGKTAADFSKKWAKASREYDRIGRDLTFKLTAPIVAVGAVTTKLSMDFESSFAGMRKTLNATEKEFDELAKGMRGLSKEIPVNVNELNKIGESAGQLGVQTKNVLGFTKVMAKLAMTTNLTSEEAATMLAKFDNITTGGAQETFENMGSAIVGLGNNFATTEKDILEMSMRLAGAGASIGLTQAEILGLATALSSLGIEAEAGGTAMSRVMTRMLDAVMDGGDELKVFSRVVGEDFRDLFQKNASQAISAFVAGLGRMRDAGENINPILEDLHLNEIRVSDALRRASGAADLFSRALGDANKYFQENTALSKEAQQRINTTASQLKLLIQRIADVGITIGNALLPGIRAAIKLFDNFVPFLEKLAGAFANLPGGIQLLVVGLAGLAAAIGPAYLGLSAILGLASTGAPLLAAFTSKIITASVAIGGLALPIAPLVIALGALGVGIAAVVTNWDKLSTPTHTFIKDADRAKQSTQELREEHGLLATALDETANATARAIAKAELQARKQREELKPAVMGITSATKSLTEEQRKLGTAFGETEEPVRSFYDTAIAKLREWMSMTPQAQAHIQGIAEKARSEAEALRKMQQEDRAIIDAQNALARHGQKVWEEYEKRVGSFGDRLSGVTGILIPFQGELKKTTEGVNELGGGGGGGGGGGASGAKDKVKGLSEEIKNLQEELKKVGKSAEEIIKIEAAAKLAAGEPPKLVEEWTRVRLEILRSTKAVEVIEELEENLKGFREEVARVGADLPELRRLAIIAIEAKVPWDKLNEEELARTKELLDQIKAAMLDLDLAESAQAAGDAFAELEKEFGLLPEKTKETKKEFDSLGPFIGNVTSTISDSFVDMFDDIGKGWDSMLDGLWDAFKQFAAAIITNPIRIILDAALSGGGGGGGAEGGVKAGLDLGAMLGGIGESFRSLGSLFAGQWAGLTGFFGTLSASLPAIGLIAAAAFGVFEIVKGLLKKSPRLDIDFDSVRTEMGRRAAVISEILDPDFFAGNIAEISVKRGGVGIGAGGDSGIIKLIQERLAETIEGIQAIISKLPTDMFTALNETLQNADLDIDTEIGGERLLEFDAKGKKIAEKFQAFIEGELPAKLFAAIRDSFFAPALESLGVSTEATEALIDQFMADMEAAGSREARAAIGQEFLENFNAFVDAFNIVSGNANDAISQTIQSVQNLSASLGFDAVPSIEELEASLAEMIHNAEIDPETVQAYADLRNAIASLTLEITKSISSIIGKIDQLNQSIVAMGGSAVDTSGWLWDAAGQVQDFLGAEMGSLSLGEQEAYLDELMNLANELFAQEMAAFEAEQARALEAAQKAAEAQRAAVQGRIDGLEAEKDRIEDAFRARIDALEEELRVAEQFKDLAESVRDTLNGIIFGGQSIWNPIEQVNMLQADIARMQAALAGAASPEERLALSADLEDAFASLHQAAADAFGTTSPEFHAIFDQVTGGLEALARLSDEGARSAEQIAASIEEITKQNEAHLASIDARIEAAQAELASIGEATVENTFQASERLKELFEYIRSEYTRLLEERFDQLGEISETGFQTELEGLGVVAESITELGHLAQEQLGYLEGQLAEATAQTGLLAKIAQAFGESIPGYAGGTGGIKDFGEQSLAFLHGKEAVLTEGQLRAMQSAIAGVAGSGGLIESFINEVRGGDGRVSALAGRLTGRGLIESLAGKLRAGDPLAEALVRAVERHAAAGGEGGRVEALKDKITVDINLNGDANPETRKLFAGELARELNNYLREWAEEGQGRDSIKRVAGKL